MYVYIQVCIKCILCTCGLPCVGRSWGQGTCRIDESMGCETVSNSPGEGEGEGKGEESDKHQRRDPVHAV